MVHTFVIPSIDGPFYYIQVNSILHTGTVVYADPPLTFYLFTLFTLIVRNTVAGVIIGSAIFAAITAVSVYFLFRHIFKNEVPAIVASLASAFSAEHIAMSSNLMKNAVGVFFIVGVIFFLQRCLDTQKRTKWNLVGAVGFFLLTMFTHVLDQGVALLFIGGYLILSLVLPERKKFFLTYGTIFLLSIISSFSGFLLLPQFFGTFQKGFNFASEVVATSASSQLAGGAPLGMSVTDPFVYLLLGVGLILSVYEWTRGGKKNAVLVTAATAIGIMLILPFIPSDYAWRFQLMEFIPVSVIVGYACARISRRDLRVLAVIALILPVVALGFQTATTLTPTISTQEYADLQKMATLVSSNNSALLVQGMGMPYWPEFILNLPVVTNSTIWLQSGYNVYVLVTLQGQPGTPNQNPNTSGGASGGGSPSFSAFNGTNSGQQGPPFSQGPPGIPNGGNLPNSGPQNPTVENNQNLNLTNATLIYTGTAFSLYKL